MRMIFYGLMLTMFLSAVNQTIVATALPTIGRDFGDFENLSWVIIAYLLSSTVVSVLYGKLSDIYGRRAMMVTAIGLFVVGSAASALAPNMAVLILARTLQGIGGGGVVPLVQTAIADMVAPRERAHYQVYMAITWIAAGITGPALGGFIAEHMHWSAIFWFNVPLGIIAGLMTYRAMRRLPRYDRRHKLDLIGGALLVAASTALLLALTWGGTRYAWLSAEIFGLILASGVLTILFGWWLTRVQEPFLPLSVLANPVVRSGTLATSMVMGAVIGLTIYMPLYFQVVPRLSIADSGLALIPIVVMTTPGSLIAGRAMMHLRRYKWVAMVGAAVALGACLAMALWPSMPLVWMMVTLGLIGIGAGCVYPTATISIQNAVAMTQVGTATGVMNFFRALASALAVAVMGAILLAGLGATAQRGAGVEILVAHAGAAGVDVAVVFRWIFAASAAFIAVGLVALAAMEERVLRSSAMKSAEEVAQDGTPPEAAARQPAE
jgi:EmrB/QacA subfamily drug resistance transporter